MIRDDDEDLLAPVDLHAWRVPPPAADARAAILTRALAPAVPPPRARLRWPIVALAAMNLVLAALVVIVIVRPAPAPAIVTRAAGGGLDADTRDVLRRLDRQQRALERKLADIDALRDTIEQLADKVADCEQTVRRDPPVPPGPRPRRDKQPDPPTVESTDAPPEAPSDAPPAAPDPTCDEVSCVLSNYEGACCTKYRHGPVLLTPPRKSSLSDSLDRAAIADGMAQIRSLARACGPAKGQVMVHVRVTAAGSVGSVTVESAPDDAVGACVAAAVRHASFSRTVRGGSFRYPFVF
ncbi:MAG TPA: hypothetical protein VFQ53_09580 [Kofleriaceae bacterium]|nr:hypothetical protein [Kofleriaceae bacterium]